MDFSSNIAAILLLAAFGTYLLTERFFKEKIAVLNAVLAISSLLIYAIWYPPAVIVLIIYSLLIRFCGPVVYKTRSRLFLGVIIFILVSILGFFKYHIISGFISKGNEETISLLIPLGLSFYTCTIIAYFVDLYRDTTTPVLKYMDSLLFISFWPTVPSGPILRKNNFFKYINNRESLTKKTIALSFVLIASGIIKKLFIANNLGAYVNWNIAFGVERMELHVAWATIIGFSAQIYGDFSGYSDMAIGFALLLGFRIPANFNYPFVASSITELWRRWHISLSFWLRDYVYIPLGGSRKGVIRKQVNIIITFVVSALWHGTGTVLNYVVWGTLNGIFMVLENIFDKAYTRIHERIRVVITFFLFTIAVVFFRLDFKNGCAMMKRMFLPESLNFTMTSPMYVLPIYILVGYMVLEHCVKFYKVDDEGFPQINTRKYAMVLLCIMLLIALLFPGKDLPFIYFQF